MTDHIPNPEPIGLAYQAAVARGDDRQAALLERALDEYTVPPRPGISVDGAAGWYANRGMRVFPLQQGEKRPLPGSHGLKDATTDRAVVAGFRWNGHNIGIATGDPFDVIDIDGPEGVAAFARVLGDGSWLPVRGITQTPRGWHIWVPADPNARNGASGKHLDFRARGGYVVVPPSHVNGTIYRWLLPPT